MAGATLLGRIYIPRRVEVVIRGEMVMEARDYVDAEGGPSGLRGAAPPRRKWALTQEAFDKLLAALDPDRENAVEDAGAQAQREAPGLRRELFGKVRRGM